MNPILCMALPSLVVIGALFTGCEDKQARSALVQMKERLDTMEDRASALESKVQRFEGALFRHVDNHTPPVTPPVKAEVLSPVWIRENRAQQLFSSQVLLSVYDTSETHATLHLTMPDGEVTEWPSMLVGTRKSFAYRGETYFLQLVDAGPFLGAKVAITRQVLD